MTVEQRKKLAAHMQRLLKVRNISFPIANTEKGPLSLKYVKDAVDYEIVLDAVPLNMNDYDNRELKSLLEKYLFEKEEESVLIATPQFQGALTDEGGMTPQTPCIDGCVIGPYHVGDCKAEKKRGRPAGSKNKK